MVVVSAGMRESRTGRMGGGRMGRNRECDVCLQEYNSGRSWRATSYDTVQKTVRYVRWEDTEKNEKAQSYRSGEKTEEMYSSKIEFLAMV